MIERVGGSLKLREQPACAEAESLERDGYALIEGALDAADVLALRSEVEAIFDAYPPDERMENRHPKSAEMFRYEMLNRGAACQAAVASPAILRAIEPCLGDDCHVIANTAWRNPPGHYGASRGSPWHTDAGPHVPRPEGVAWPDEIPYPIFAIGAHILLQDLSRDDGPTGVLSGSHRSGRLPPPEQIMDDALCYEGQAPVPLVGKAGDVALVVSDAWHRRLPASERDRGRLFLQVHYARRDLAQRLRKTSESGQLSAEAIERADSSRERKLIGLHEPYYYDG